MPTVGPNYLLKLLNTFRVWERIDQVGRSKDDEFTTAGLSPCFEFFLFHALPISRYPANTNPAVGETAVGVRGILTE